MFMDFLSFWVIPVLAVLAISQTQNDRTCHRESKVVVKWATEQLQRSMCREIYRHLHFHWLNCSKISRSFPIKLNHFHFQRFFCLTISHAIGDSQSLAVNQSSSFVSLCGVVKPPWVVTFRLRHPWWFATVAAVPMYFLCVWAQMQHVRPRLQRWETPSWQQWLAIQRSWHGRHGCCEGIGYEMLSGLS